MNKLVKSLSFSTSMLCVCAPALADPPPKLKAEFHNTIVRTVKIISHDLRKVVVERVVINNRGQLDYCNITHMWGLDSLASPQGGTVPLTRFPISIGESVAVRADARCMDPVIVDVFTNLGHVRFSFE